MKLLKFLTPLFFIALIFNSCNKPSKRLLINNWSADEVIKKTKKLNTRSFPPGAYNYGIIFNKNNTYENFGARPSAGTWKINKSESTIELIMDDNNVTYKLPEKMNVLSLNKDELLVSFTLNGFEYECKFRSSE